MQLVVLTSARCTHSETRGGDEDAEEDDTETMEFTGYGVLVEGADEMDTLCTDRMLLSLPSRWYQPLSAIVKFKYIVCLRLV